jgi:general secretion pathway protein C
VSAESIIVRNPFDSVTGALNKPPPAPEPSASAPPVPTIVDPYAAPPCDGVKLLVITASTDPDWSFAAFSTGADGKSLLRRRGGEVGNKQVKYIAWDRVWMTSGTALCQTTMFRPPGTPSAPPPPPPPPQLPSAPAGGASPVPPEISKGVVRVSGTEFNIDRSVVDRILDNQADLMRQARIVPEQENGKVVGIRLFGVRPDTLLGVLGMENGDRLEKINGFEMASPEKALEAYARLRTADHLTVQVNRRGQAVNLDFNIK